MTNSRLATLLSTTAFAVLGLGAPALGQTAQAPEAEAIQALDEVVVTARRREERLIDVPVAATVMNNERLDRYASTSLVQISQLAPNVNIQPSGNGSGAAISIRGIGSTAADSGVEQTVSINIDGVPVGRGRIITVAMFDLASVEVLKGPQALFFGKNSPGGVISINSVLPGSELGGYARAGYEFRSNHRYAEGAVTLPFGETLAARLALRASEREGFIQNVAKPLPSPFQPSVILPGAAAPHSTISEVAGRLTVRWEPTDRFNLVGRALVARSLELNAVGGENVCTASVKPRVTNLGIPDPFSDCEIDLRTSLGTITGSSAAGFPASNGGKPFQDVRSRLFSLTGNYEMGQIDITSVSSFYKFSSINFAPLSGAVFAYFGGANNEWNTTLTQELRAVSNFESPLNFTVGVYLEDGDRRFQNVSQLGPLPADAEGRTYTDQVDFQTDSRTYSLFGQLRFTPTDQIELAGGLRWTREEKAGFLGNTFVHSRAVIPLKPQGQFIHHDISDENLSPEVTLTWKPRTNLTLYAAYKTGYKSPGFTNTIVVPPSFTEANTRFAAETAQGGEVGVKFALMGGRFSGDVTAYRYDFKDLQVVSFDSTTINYLVRNAAAARTQGIEAQGVWVVNDRLRLEGNASWINAEFIDFKGAPCYVGQTTGCVLPQRTQDISGKTLPLTPEFSGRFAASYDHPLVGDLMMNVTADVTHKSSYVLSLTYSPYVNHGSVTLINAAVRLFQSGAGWELALIGRNLTDERYAHSAGDIPGGGIGDLGVNVGDPRTIAIQGTYRF